MEKKFNKQNASKRAFEPNKNIISNDYTWISSVRQQCVHDIDSCYFLVKIVRFIRRFRLVDVPSDRDLSTVVTILLNSITIRHKKKKI